MVFYVGICTDGAAVLTGRLSGLSVWKKKVELESESTHCIIQREMLASQKMTPELNSVLNDIVNVINHIKLHARNSGLLQQLCEEIVANHRHLLLYSEMRWLSRGKSRTRVLELQKLLPRFLLLPASPYSGSPQRESVLHLIRSTSSASLAPTLSMSSLAKSIHLLLGLLLLLLSGTAISIISFPT